MLELIEQRQFDDITIRDITNQAGVSYPVFFRRYAGKDEVLADVATREIRNLIEATYPALSGEGPHASLERLCAHIVERRLLWTTLLTTGAASRMRDEFIKASAEIGESSARANPWLPVSLASGFVAAGIFEILAWWLRQDDDYPVANVVVFLEELVVNPTLSPREVPLA